MGQAVTSHFYCLMWRLVKSNMVPDKSQTPGRPAPAAFRSATFLGRAGALKDLCVSAPVLACPSALICRVPVSKGTTL